MFRYLVAHLPCFRLERCGWESHQTVVLLAEERRALRVQATTPAAQKLGVRAGMSSAEARALVPDIRTEILEPEAERQDLEALAEQLLRFSPSVSTLPPDALVAELRGETAERTVLEHATVRLRHLGHQAVIAIADDPATALAVATWGRRDQIVPPGQGALALAPLPLEALGLPNNELVLLQGLGVRTVGAFAALPPAAVSGRLGPVGVAAHGLARGRGLQNPMPARPGPPGLRKTQELSDPVSELEALLFVINALLRDVAAALGSQGKAAVRVSLHFRLEKGEQELSVRLGEPTRDPKRMLSLLRPRLEQLQLPSPVTSLSVEIPEPVPFGGKQTGLLDWHAVGEALTDVMARLQDQLGEDAVRSPRLESQHRPETAWRAVPVRLASSGGRGGAAAARALAQDPVHIWEGQPAEVQPDRPPILLPLPLAIDVRLGADRLPKTLLLENRFGDVQVLRGPEVLSAEWWERPLHRAYYRASLTDGRDAWIYQEDGRWALHGWWDR